MMIDYTEIKQILVLVALIIFATLILIPTTIMGMEITQEQLTILNIIIGVLAGVLGTKAISNEGDKK